MTKSHEAPPINKATNSAPEDTSPCELSARTRSRSQNLPSAQWELIEVCLRVTEVLGFPRTVGEIFGFIFSNHAPVTFDEVVQALGISNGSASHGIRYLRRIGAISTSYYARDRRDYFQAETSLQKVLKGYLAEKIFLKLDGMANRLNNLHLHLVDRPDTESMALCRRVSLLRDWNTHAGSSIMAALQALD